MQNTLTFQNENISLSFQGFDDDDELVVVTRGGFQDEHWYYLDEESVKSLIEHLQKQLKTLKK